MMMGEWKLEQGRFHISRRRRRRCCVYSKGSDFDFHFISFKPVYRFIFIKRICSDIRIFEFDFNTDQPNHIIRAYGHVKYGWDIYLYVAVV